MSSTLKKICTTCGRQITWRKKWEKNWEAITYCSDSCRKHKIKPNSLDTAFESRILSLLHERKRTLGTRATVTCEEAEVSVLDERSESCVEAGAGERNDAGDVDGGVAGQGNGQMKDGIDGGGKGGGKEPARTRERCRQAARRLAARGEILVTQEGKVVDPSFAKAIMELRLPS